MFFNKKAKNNYWTEYLFLAIPTILFVFWLIIGLSWNSRYGARYDENDYVKGGMLIVVGHYDLYAAGSTGTLNRPYLYPLFLSCIEVIRQYLHDVWGFQHPADIRLIAGPVQGYLFLTAVNRLALAAGRFGSWARHGIRIGLLCQPFLAFLMSELLSDTISIILWILLSSVLLNVITLKDLSWRNSWLRNLKIGCLFGALIVARSANLPVAVVGLSVVAFLIIWGRSRAAQDVSSAKRGFVLALGNLCMLAAGCTTIIIPQAVVMARHLELSGQTSQFWGAGTAAAGFGLHMLKYTTAVETCDNVIPAAVPYENPFQVTELEEEWVYRSTQGTIVYYATHPLYAMLHIFNGINYDFPTTYIMSWNRILNRSFNFISVIFLAGAISGGLVRTDLWITPAPYIQYKNGLGLLLISFFVLVNTLQLSIISVENRYGVVAWSWISVWFGITLMSMFLNADIIKVYRFLISVTIISVAIFFLSEWVTNQSIFIITAYNLFC